MKKKIIPWGTTTPGLVKLFKVMRIILLIMVAAVSNALASPTYSQVTRLSIEMEGTSLEEVLDEIESQSEFYFLFNQKQIDVNRMVNIKIKNKSLENVLNELFANTNVRYQIFDRQVLLLANQNVSPLRQDNRRISGLITDEKGEPLVGVNIIEKNTTTGTISGIDGRYEIRVSEGTTVLVFQFIGKVTQEIAIDGRSEINLRMAEDIIGMDEVIVTGVATGTPKRKLGFAIDKIGVETLQRVPGVDAASAIQGKVAGVRITKVSGAPGSDSDIQLRGVKTIFGSSNPLIIVDGVQTELGLSDINAEDIESIEVLKGAAASSLYGSRAANGVVSIFTKRGNTMAAGKVQVDYRLESGKSYMGFVPSKSKATYKTIENGVVTINDDPDRIMDNPYPTTFDHVSQFFNPGAYNTHYLALRGNSGDSKVSVFSSIQTSKEDGVVTMVNGSDRTNVRLNLDYRITDKLNFTTSNLFSQTTSDNRALAAFGRLLDSDPNADLTLPNADGTPYLVNVNKIKTANPNPLYEIDNTISDSKSQKLLSFFGFKYRPVDYITLEASYGTTRSSGEDFYLSPKGKLRTDLTEDNGYISRGYYDTKEEIVTIEGSYHKKFGDFNTRIKGQYLYEKSASGAIFGGGNDLGVRGMGVTSLNLSSNQSTSSSTYKNIANNVASIVAVDYKDKYILDALIRRDASSLFGADVRWQTFYRTSAAWRITEDVKISGVNEWKLRASYGVAGLRPPFEAQYEVFSLVNGVPGNMETLGNTQLRPSFSKELEVGTDIYFLERFSLSFSYSNANNTDQILKVPVSPLSGAAFQWQNAGTIKSTSYEASLGYNVFRNRNVTWDLGIYFDRVRQKITKLEGTPYMLNGTRFRIEEGIDFGVLYLDIFARTLDDVANQIPAGRTADEWFAVNNQGFIVERSSIGTINEKPVKIKDDKGNIVALPAANFNPDFNANLTSTLSFKGFTFYTLLAWQQGGQVYNHSIRYTVEPGFLDQSELPWNAVKPIGYYENSGQTGGILGWDNDVLAFDATFLKLRELSVSYDFKPKSIEKFVQNIRISAIGRNLLTLTTYPGFDPETGLRETGKGVDANAFRFDSNNSYPLYRMISGSIAVTF